MIKDPRVGDIASFIPEGQWHESRFVDLTTEMKAYKPLIPWSTSNAYYELEYKLALLLLKPTIGRMPGGEYFGEMLVGPAIPKSWNAFQRPFPPETKVLHESIPSYGTLHRCDHYRSSGCEVKLRVIRQHARFPGQDLFQCSISKGWHRHACNHRSTKNVKKTGRTEGSVPAAHPMIDIFCRNHCKERKPGDATPILRHVQTSLVRFLRTHPVLHCEYPHADDDVGDAKDGHFCLHARTHEYISSLNRFEHAADMPPTEPVDVVQKSRPSRRYKKTISQWTTVDHMLCEDGFSDAGSHVFQHHVITQVKYLLAKWNKFYLGRDHISLTTTSNSSVGAMHANFKEMNLHAQWLRMQQRPNAKRGDPGLLDPFKWNIIGLLYRHKTKKEMDEQKGSAKTKKTTNDNDWCYAESFDDLYPEDTDARKIPFEFVAVFGSIMSLIVGVKAWALRKVMGHVQICADNMYNCLRGVPGMLWFNTGVIDAKGIHFPTVNALTLGRAKPRNKVRTTCYPITFAPVSIFRSS
jgi:hypothetical protein